MTRLRISLVVLAALFGVWLWQVPDTLAIRSSDYGFFDPLIDVRADILRYFVEEPDEQGMLEGALRGMIDTLEDPYTVYFNSEELNMFDNQVLASLSGIGAEIDVHEGHLRIVSPLEDSPAFEAGLTAGDIVLSIDGEPATDLSVQEAVKRISGPEGTEVTLEVRHPDGSEETLTITRRKIEIQTVKGLRRGAEHGWDFMVDPEAKIGYVRLTQFAEPTAETLRQTLEALRDQDMHGLILDLRYNSGGLMGSAIEIADMFLEEGTIVSTRGRNTPERIWKAEKEETLPDFPVVVLVNEFSASASEILAGALKDNDRAVVIGTRTFGKGSVQQVLPLAEEKGAIKITIAHYYLPSGRNIHRREKAEAWGVDPNEGYYIRLSDEQRIAMLEARRSSDVLHRPDEVTGSRPEVTPEWLEEHLKDPQLARALETLQARLNGGEFIPVGEEEKATLLAHQTERETLIRQRELFRERLDRIDEELSRIDTLLAEGGMIDEVDEASEQAAEAPTTQPAASAPEEEPVLEEAATP